MAVPAIGCEVGEAAKHDPACACNRLSRSEAKSFLIDFADEYDGSYRDEEVQRLLQPPTSSRQPQGLVHPLNVEVVILWICTPLIDEDRAVSMALVFILFIRQ